MRRTRSRVVSLCCCAVLLSACDSSTGNSDKSITLALATNTVSLSQGGTAQVAVTIQRNNFEEPVSLSIDGTLPQGVTATFSPATMAAGVSMAILNLTAAGNATPTTAGAFTVRAAGQGVTAQTQDVAVNVATTGSYTLGLLEPGITAAQGGGGVATVLLTRNGGNAGDVTLSTGSLPAGITASFGQSPTTAAGGSLLLSVGPAVATGTYPVEVMSTSPGHADQSATLSLAVVAPPATESATMLFCAASMPVWIAYRNEGFGWQVVTPGGGGNITFEATERVSVAVAFAGSGGTRFNVYQLHRSELAYFSDSGCPGTRNYSGQVAGLSTGQASVVALGPFFDVRDAASPAWSLDNLPNRPLDLVASRGVITSQTYPSPDRIILRRGIDAPSGALAELNFTSAESFAPASGLASVNNLIAGSEITVQHALLTTTATYGLLQLARSSSSPVSLAFVPADKLIAGDVHELFLIGSQSSGAVGQAVVEYSTTPGDRSVSLGPSLSVPSVTSVPSSYKRPRATFASQPEYPSLAFAIFEAAGLLGTIREVLVLVSQEYLGATPPQWELVVPEFSGVPGFNTNWMLANGSSTESLVQAFDGPADLLLGAKPQAGDSYRLAFHNGSSSALRLARSGWPAAVRPLPQYLRR